MLRKNYNIGVSDLPTIPFQNLPIFKRFLFKFFVKFSKVKTEISKKLYDLFICKCWRIIQKNIFYRTPFFNDKEKKSILKFVSTGLKFWTF